MGCARSAFADDPNQSQSPNSTVVGGNDENVTRNAASETVNGKNESLQRKEKQKATIKEIANNISDSNEECNVATLRGVPFSHLRNAEERKLAFSSSKGDMDDYNLSFPVQKVDVFVSHCWHDDGALKFYYLSQKIAELQIDGQLSDDPILWIDKFCIHQTNSELMKDGVLKIGEWLDNSASMIVLGSTRYLSRLWCIFEWCVYMKLKRPIYPCFVPQLSLDQMIPQNRSISDFIAREIDMKQQEVNLNKSIARLCDLQRLGEEGAIVKDVQCFDKADKEVLTNKAIQLYGSVGVFEDILMAQLPMLTHSLGTEMMSEVVKKIKDMDVEIIDWDQGLPLLNTCIQRIWIFTQGENRYTAKANLSKAGLETMYSFVYKMCVQRDPHNHSEKAYKYACKCISDYVQEVVLNSLSRASVLGASKLMEESIFQHKNTDNFSALITKVFGYLERFYVPNSNLHSFKEFALKEFIQHSLPFFEKSLCQIISPEGGNPDSSLSSQVEMKGVNIVNARLTDLDIGLWKSCHSILKKAKDANFCFSNDLIQTIELVLGNDYNEIDTEGQSPPETEDERELKLITKDGVEFTAAFSEMKVCGFVTNVIDQNFENDQITIQTPEIHSKIMTLAIEFCQHYLRQPMIEIKKPLRSNDLKDVVQEWYATFVQQLDLATLYGIVAAANFLDNQPLLHLGCAQVAAMIKGKPLEEIKGILSVKTEEEKC